MQRQFSVCRVLILTVDAFCVTPLFARVVTSDYRPRQVQHQQQLGEQGSGLHLGAPQFEPVGIDPMSFGDYPNQFVPSMDSPNVNIDYSQQQVCACVCVRVCVCVCAGGHR